VNRIRVKPTSTLEIRQAFVVPLKGLTFTVS
jgi:hypothetical protein